MVITMSSYKRLLPREVGSRRSDGNADPSTTLTDADRPASPPRVCFVNTVACGQCRQKKCGGQRPICDRCARNGIDCHYDANIGESRASTLRKRYGALDREVGQLREENRHFKKLYSLIRTGTENETLKVLSNIRSSSNYIAIAVPRLLGQGDTTLAGPTASSSSVKENDETSVKTFNAFVADIQALPWTVVAGNDVVSELISQYFTFDYLYVFPAIPRSIFIYEMNSGDPAASTACTPLLVNAICFLSPKESFGLTPREDMAEQFLREANTLLQKETKRDSLPTCPATCLIHAAVAVKDEASGDVFAKVVFT
ncbi:C6 transcription factor [Pochonia chlamydosporia 170]|uniref:C6 transcription factor n=1 Tax=Pochonia chlamydosporia 170 TaxID=1380566 RepID=A0A179F661_METCM|nr:C6 transcription factor [Pochonia chlamydosporia 170]OAQ60882.2 C6 transcription factor [Pochonia chlamydosporia 170]